MYKDWENVCGIKMNSFAHLLRDEARKKPLTQAVPPEVILCEAEVKIII